MEQQAIHQYLVDYFSAGGCDILENRHGLLKVKLTVELDKLLMNRPFYWHYIEKIGGKPETQMLTLKTVQSDDEGEFIHFGSPRLHQIFSSSKELSRYIRLYEDRPANGHVQTPLYPWLGVNVKVSFQCDLKKDFLLSLGLNLLNGMIVKEFQEGLEKLRLTPKIPDYCYTMTPIIKPISGLKRLEAVIEQLVAQEDHAWADDARDRLNNDLELLERFYEDLDPEEFGDAYEKEKQSLKDLYEPKIITNIINGGLFYLTAGAFQ
ncbi:MAG: YqhG family protein [Tuberibacillus sp.]